MTTEQGIATGYNADPGAIERFTALVASDNLPFPPARVVGSYSPGDPVLRGTKTITFEGDETCSLRFHKMTPPQLKFLNDDFCNGLYWGHVTLNLNLFTSTDFDLYNATIIIPTQDALKGQYDATFDRYDEVEIRVLELELITP